jgi:hypothetical protein
MGKKIDSRKVLLLSVFLIACLTPSFAYLDPGTGSSIIQLLIAGALGGAYVVKTYWYKIIGFFKGSEVEKDAIEDDEL